MKLGKFGDSYDIVKQGLLRWLSPCGPWVAHPMFTDPVDALEVSAFSRFLGVPLLSTEVLDPGSDRDAYFSTAASCPDHLFLDPDTGLKIPAASRSDAPAFVNGIGVTLLGRRNVDPETATYVKTLAVTFIWLPVFVLRAYRVLDAPNGGWHFIGREPPSNFALAWNFLGIPTVAGAIMLIENL